MHWNNQKGHVPKHESLCLHTAKAFPSTSSWDSPYPVSTTEGLGCHIFQSEPPRILARTEPIQNTTASDTMLGYSFYFRSSNYSVHMARQKILRHCLITGKFQKTKRRREGEQEYLVLLKEAAIGFSLLYWHTVTILAQLSSPK